MCIIVGFPSSSVGKELTCNAGDPGPIPELGRSSGEGIGTHHSLKWWGNPSHTMWCTVEPHQGILSRDKTKTKGRSICTDVRSSKILNEK